MKNSGRRIEIVRGINSKRIADEIIELHRERVFEYIETMASELSAMAAGSGQKFLGYLLNLASTEAKTSKFQTRSRGASA